MNSDDLHDTQNRNTFNGEFISDEVIEGAYEYFAYITMIANPLDRINSIWSLFTDTSFQPTDELFHSVVSLFVEYTKTLESDLATFNAKEEDRLNLIPGAEFDRLHELTDETPFDEIRRQVAIASNKANKKRQRNGRKSRRAKKNRSEWISKPRKMERRRERMLASEAMM